MADITIDATLAGKVRTAAGLTEGVVDYVNESGWAARPHQEALTEEGKGHLDVPVHAESTGMAVYVDGQQVYPTDANIDEHATVSDDGKTITTTADSGFGAFIGA